LVEEAILSEVFGVFQNDVIDEDDLGLGAVVEDEARVFEAAVGGLADVLEGLPLVRELVGFDVSVPGLSMTTIL
jgi:hypothetical protein